MMTLVKASPVIILYGNFVKTSSVIIYDDVSKNKVTDNIL